MTENFQRNCQFSGKLFSKPFYFFPRVQGCTGTELLQKPEMVNGNEIVQITGI